MKEIIKEYWSKRADDYNKFVKCSMHSTKKKAWQGILMKTLGEEKLKILDVGTGPGLIALLLAELGHDVTGIDLSEEMLKNARENAKTFSHPAKFMQGDAEDLPFEMESFDAIINRALLWTLSNPEKAIVEWKRILKPNGKLVIIDGSWYLNIDSSLKRKVWRVFAMPLIGITERKIPSRRCYNQDLKERLPVVYKKRPDYDVELLKSLGFGDINIQSMSRRTEGLLEYLKYGYWGDSFLVMGVKTLREV